MGEVSPSSTELMCREHEIKEVPRYGIAGTIWDKQNCPYCKIERLQRENDTLRNEIAGYKANAYYLASEPTERPNCSDCALVSVDDDTWRCTSCKSVFIRASQPPRAASSSGISREICNRLLEIVGECERWHSGDKWRQSDESRERQAWEKHQTALTEARAFLSTAPSREVNPLGFHAYAMSEPHLSGYRLIVGFETLEQMQAAHQVVADAGKAAAAARGQS